MAAKRNPPRTDPSHSLRDHVVDLLGVGHAHILEHIRLSQWNIVECTKSARHVSPQ